MEQPEDVGGLTKSAAVAVCTAMAVFYVAILYSPTLILRLPPPNSFKSYMVRRFVCAAISSIFSVIVCSIILPITRWDASDLFDVYGVRLDHVWQALVFPLSLTSFMYTGSFVLKLLAILQTIREHLGDDGNLPAANLKSIYLKLINWVVSTTTSVAAWRNYFVAPLTEELVFRACMIPLLLCGGFSASTVVLLCPIFFSLAHLNHLLEYFGRQDCSLLKALTVVGFQLGYTVIFGAYASFLLVRTGHLTAPLVSHMFCNFMGLPVIVSRRSGIVTVAFIMGLLCFFWLLFPFTSPHLYNSNISNCKCWHRYCNWSQT